MTARVLHSRRRTGTSKVDVARMPRLSRDDRVRLVGVVRRSIGIAGASCLIVACSNTPPAPEGLYFPTYQDADSYPTALLEGQLRRAGPCLFYENAAGDQSLLVWSSRYHAVESSGTILIQDASGSVVAAQDQHLRAAGGELPREHPIVKALVEAMPAQCDAGVYAVAARVGSDE